VFFRHDFKLDEMCQGTSNLVLKVTEESCEEHKFKVSLRSSEISFLAYPLTHTHTHTHRLYSRNIWSLF